MGRILMSSHLKSGKSLFHVCSLVFGNNDYHCVMHVSKLYRNAKNGQIIYRNGYKREITELVFDICHI